MLDRTKICRLAARQFLGPYGPLFLAFGQSVVPGWGPFVFDKGGCKLSRYDEGIEG